MRRLTVGALLALCSCAGFRALDRADWVLVWSDETVQTLMVNGTPIEVVKPTPGARQEIISRDRYDAEIVEGKRRKASAALGQVPKLVTEIKGPIELMLGEVRELRIDEPKQDAVVFVSGSAVRPYWTKPNEVAEYKEGKELDRHESSLFLVADDAGSSKVKVQYPGKEPIIIEVSVHER